MTTTMVSLSDVQTPAGWTKIQVIWDLSVTALDTGSCRYTNQVLSYPTPAFLEMLQVGCFDPLLENAGDI